MIYILYGNDEGRLQQKVEAIRKKHKTETVMELDALTVPQDEALAEMDTISIFSEPRLILLKHATFLSAKNTTKYELDPFLERAGEEGVIIVMMYEGAKLDQRKKKVKELMAVSTVYSCIALDQRSQPEYIHEQIKKMNLRMDADALRWFCGRVGMDSIRIKLELYKLKTYNDHITLSDVQHLVTPEPVTDVFKMVDALFAKNPIRLLAFYRNFRAQNMEPVAILALLASQIRFLFQVRVYMDQSLTKDEIASELKAHPYRVQINMQKAASFSAQELLEQLDSLAQLDQNMKMGLIDKDQGFESFILSLH